MTATQTNLLQIKGIGEILAKRLGEAGIDSCAALTKAGKKGLLMIKGVNPRAVSSILEQAAFLQEESTIGKEERLAAVKANCNALRAAILNVAESGHQRFKESLKGKTAEKLTATLVRLIDTVDDIEAAAHKRIKRTGKALFKAEQQLEKLVDTGHKDLSKGFVKARKTLRRALK